VSGLCYTSIGTLTQGERIPVLDEMIQRLFGEARTYASDRAVEEVRINLTMHSANSSRLIALRHNRTSPLAITNRLP